jgi:hypothetical protein
VSHAAPLTTNPIAGLCLSTLLYMLGCYFVVLSVRLASRPPRGHFGQAALAVVVIDSLLALPLHLCLSLYEMMSLHRQSFENGSAGPEIFGPHLSLRLRVRLRLRMGIRATFCLGVANHSSPTHVGSFEMRITTPHCADRDFNLAVHQKESLASHRTVRLR